MQMVNGAKCFAFADDLAVIAEADGKNQLMNIGNKALRMIVNWMKAHSLTPVLPKSKAVVL